MRGFKYIQLQIIRNKWSGILVVLFASFAVVLFSLSRELIVKSDEHLNKSVSGVDLVVGAKGSPLQLVLSSLFLIDNPTGNISVGESEKIIANPMVQNVLKMGFGDQIKGYKLVGLEGTASEFFPDLHIGGLKTYELLVGNTAAAQLAIEPGDKLHAHHGSDNGKEHEDEFVVKATLPSCNCPRDIGFFTSMETIYGMHPNAPREYTSLLISTKTPLAKLQLPRIINNNSNLQAALPSIEVDRLKKLSAGAYEILNALSYLFFVVCGLALLAAIMARLRDVQRDFALLFFRGFNKSRVIGLFLAENVVLLVIGYGLGLIAYAGLIYFIGSWIKTSYGVGLNSLPDLSVLLLAAINLLLCCIVAGFIPTVKYLVLPIRKIIQRELK
ncbi:ABC transporter permease [Luteibaculum oceani]|uniref:FtsX-like permease family protein n=1 Tax=Luteibaculum oceani TaxID=1294296 RepID=A0A5C6V4B6_9FLAO|nr:FtsX-like permease family protein [Luteibaculum oceani]TXC78558.1 FtsX-like permease family protein [Luteibaculum oceani]